MRKKSDTVHYTAKQIKARIARGEDRTNWDKIDAVTGTTLEASIRAEVDDVQIEPDWTQAIVGMKEHAPAATAPEHEIKIAKSSAKNTEEHLLRGR